MKVVHCMTGRKPRYPNFDASSNTRLWSAKPLYDAKGKNAIELGSEADVADVLGKVREAVELGELDALIEKQAQFGRRLSLKNK